MISEKVLMARLEKRQAELAMSSLRSPGDKSSFTFGAASGVLAGIDYALAEILSMIKEEREGDTDL